MRFLTRNRVFFDADADALSPAGPVPLDTAETAETAETGI